MTKLLEYLSFGFTLLSLWLTLVLEKPFKLQPNIKFHVTLAPIYAVLLFGFISLAILLFRVATFNDCPQAYKELQQEIIEAREDLKNKGFKDVTVNENKSS